MGFQKCISVPDVGIRYIHTVVTYDGVFAIGTTDSQMVSYKAFFDGELDEFLHPCCLEVASLDIMKAFSKVKRQSMDIGNDLTNISQSEYNQIKSYVTGHYLLHSQKSSVDQINYSS